MFINLRSLNFGSDRLAVIVLLCAMAIFRQYIAPFLIVLVFLFALMAVGVRSFLPSDMAAPAPIEAIDQNAENSPSETTPDVADLPPSLETLVRGLPADTIGTQL